MNWDKNHRARWICPVHPSSRPEWPGHDKSPDGKWSMKAALKKNDIDGKFSRFSLYWPSWVKDLRCCCTPDRGEQWWNDSKGHMLSVPTVCRTLSDCSRTHLAQLLVLIQGQMVVLHCLHRVSKTTSMESFGGTLLVKAISAGQSRLRSRQEHPNRWIYLAYMYATMFCKMYMNRSGYVLCMV